MENDHKQDCKQARPYRLLNQIQHYAWGGCDDRAYIAHLIGIQTEPHEPFAELWMGAHPSAPSMVLDPEGGKRPLLSWIREDPKNRLGELPNQKFGAALPYLFKVLSADRALSIQAHPNKEQARHLHQIKAEHYPDNNHKPEVAIALDFLDALVGFIPQSEYRELLATTPELGELLSSEPTGDCDLQQDVLLLLKLSVENQEKLTACQQNIYKRISGSTTRSDAESLFLQEYDAYGPDDMGLLFILLMKRVRLNAGEAIFLLPGIPHAYLKGNIIECMANSDNVVRLGLTNKFRDAGTLAEILDFSEDHDCRVETSSDGYMIEYLTPTDEFRVKSLSLIQGESRAFTYHTGLTMFLIIEGEITLKWGDKDHICSCMYRRGNAFIAPANLNEFTIVSKNHCKMFLVDIPV